MTQSTAPAPAPRKSPLLFGMVLISSIGITGCYAPAATTDVIVPDDITLDSLRYDDEVAPSGRMIEGQINVNTFAPENKAVAVDAETVDLRQIFEDLGPIATLWYQHVQTLSNPFFEGRAPESRGMEFAKQYVEFYFRLYGLEPAFPAPGQDNVAEMPGGEVVEAASRPADRNVMWTTYRQPFQFNTPGTRMRAQVSEASFAIGGEKLTEREDFTFLGVSGSGEVTAPLAFVGYGIESGPDGYSSFEDDLDLTGRVALVFRYEPLDEEGASRWGGNRFSRHASMRQKLRALRDRNAAGILLVNPPGAVQGATGLETLSRSARFGPPMDIPVVQITSEVAERILANGDDESGGLMDWRRKADEGELRTAHLDDALLVTMAGNVSRGGARMGVETENVGAVLRGKGALADEWIIIGGHMDHVGYGEFGTLPAHRGKLHPGADDNASGTAGVLILARTLSEFYENAPEDAELRSVFFLAFCAEESGLHGSRHYATNLTVPAEQISAMINMDMIGRLRDNSISVMGVGTAEGLRDVLRPHFERSGLAVNVTAGSSGRSDDVNFIRENIPAIHFFTGLHDEYHAPGDRGHTVNPAGARDLLRLVHHIAVDMASQPEPFTFTAPESSRQRTPDRGYAPVRLGIQPGMGTDLDRPGVMIEGVSPGTAAENAGLQGGDAIVAWNGEPLNGMQGLVENLRQHQPGDEVTLTILRDGEERDVQVKFPESE